MGTMSQRPGRPGTAAFYRHHIVILPPLATHYLPPAAPHSSVPVPAMYKVKIVLAGPCQAGKTMIANFLSDATESVGGEYRPTIGVRILEFEMPSILVNNKVRSNHNNMGVD